MIRQRVMVVTGSTGFIGHHLVAHFSAAGWEVRAPSRPAWELGRGLGAVLNGADVVVHAAFVPYDQPGASQTNLEGSRALIDEVRSSGHTRLVFLSSMSAHPAARSAYGRDKLAIQSWLSGPSDLTIRPGLVLGESGLFARIRHLVSRGGLIPLVGGAQQVQTVHVDDLVAAVDAAIQKELAGIVTVAEPRPVAFRRLLEDTARLVGANPRFIPIPYWPLDAALRVAGVVRLKLPVSRDNLDGLRAVQPADVTADLERLGVPIRDYRASLRVILSAV